MRGTHRNAFVGAPGARVACVLRASLLSSLSPLSLSSPSLSDAMRLLSRHPRPQTIYISSISPLLLCAGPQRYVLLRTLRTGCDLSPLSLFLPSYTCALALTPIISSLTFQIPTSLYKMPGVNRTLRSLPTCAPSFVACRLYSNNVRPILSLSSPLLFLPSTPLVFHSLFFTLSDSHRHQYAPFTACIRAYLSFLLQCEILRPSIEILLCLQVNVKCIGVRAKRATHLSHRLTPLPSCFSPFVFALLPTPTHWFRFERPPLVSPIVFPANSFLLSRISFFSLI